MALGKRMCAASACLHDRRPREGIIPASGARQPASQLPASSGHPVHWTHCSRTMAKAKEQAADAEASAVPAKQPRLSASAGHTDAVPDAASTSTTAALDTQGVVLPDSDSVATRLIVSRRAAPVWLS